MIVKDFTSFVNESKKTDAEEHLRGIGLLPKGKRDWVEDNYLEITDRCSGERVPSKRTVLRFINMFTNNNPDLDLAGIDYSDFFEWWDH
jgi:hypothetical protein